MTSGALIVLEGIDGAGKTTVQAHAEKRLQDVNIKGHNTKACAYSPEFAAESMHTISKLLWPLTETGHDAAYRPQYWLYLQVLWYTLACQFAIEPRLATGVHLLTDGWLFKFYAKMGLRGIPSQHLDEIFSSILIPDLVILLECDVKSAWSRRTFRDHEMGLHEGYVQLGFDSFVDYQTRVQSALQALALARGWPSVKIGPSDGPEKTAMEVEGLIRQFLRSRNMLLKEATEATQSSPRDH